MHTSVSGGADRAQPAVPPPLRWEDDRLFVLDQRRLPTQERWLCCTSVDDVAKAISELAVRGAPAIGLAAAFGLALAARHAVRAGARLAAEFDRAAAILLATRPTAVNLQWAIARGRRVFEDAIREDPVDAGDVVLAWARDMVVD